MLFRETEKTKQWISGQLQSTLSLTENKDKRLLVRATKWRIKPEEGWKLSIFSPTKRGETWLQNRTAVETSDPNNTEYVNTAWYKL
jgi:hypothetical protein